MERISFWIWLNEEGVDVLVFVDGVDGEDGNSMFEFSFFRVSAILFNVNKVKCISIL